MSHLEIPSGGLETQDYELRRLHAAWKSGYPMRTVAGALTQTHLLQGQGSKAQVQKGMS